VARPLYSALLLQGSGGESASPPAGDIWVIRDVAGTLFTLGTGAPSQLLFYNGSLAFYTVEQPALVARSFHWEGRQVLAGGSALSTTLLGPGTATYSISGYALSSP
jgi:hypothetical protein